MNEPGTLTTYSFAVDGTAVDVSVLADPQAKPGSPARHIAHIRLDDRPAWTHRHHVASSSRDATRSVAGSALSLLSQYLHGWASLQTPDVDRRHEWSGWAEPYAEHVRVARQALDAFDTLAAAERPSLVTAMSLSTTGGVDVFGPVRTATVGGTDGSSWTVQVVDVPVAVARTDVQLGLWSSAEVAHWWGVEETAVPATLSRAGVRPESRGPGRTGRNLYRADLVLAAKSRTTGRGSGRRRTADA